ncbi:MAG: septum formation initiator family protein [Ruminococcaceae bacterium]|nr:septum formation initiator family protein [Oscillospiraceae bacterium]
MKHGSSFFLKMAIVLFMAFSIVTILNLQQQFSELEKKHAKLKSEVEAYEERIAELQYQLDRPFDNEYIIEIARKKLNYHLPDEIIFENHQNN